MEPVRNNLGKSAPVPLFLALLAVTVAYYPSLETLWQKWTLWDQDLAHALPTIAIMLVFIARQSYVSVAPPLKSASSWLQVGLLAACSILWYLLESLNISMPAYLLIGLSLVLFLWSSFSFTTLQRLIPLLSLLLFTIPVWSELVPYLVDLSAKVVGVLVKMSRLTALIDGNSIFLPVGTIFIADGCSGIRYFTIAVLMGYIIVLLNNFSLKKAVVTLAIAAMLGLIANWLRIYLLVLIGYHTEMRSSLMQDHETFGWILFSAIMLPAIYLAPVNREKAAPIPLPRARAWLPLLALLPGPALLLISDKLIESDSPLSLSHLSQYQHTQLPNTALNTLDFTQESKAVHLPPHTFRIDLFTHSPTQIRAEIVPYIGPVIDSAKWLDVGKMEVPDGLEGKVDMRIYRGIGNTERLLVAREYIVGTTRTNSYTKAKLAQIPARLANRNYFGLWVVQIKCKQECAEESQTFFEKASTLRLPDKSD